MKKLTTQNYTTSASTPSVLSYEARVSLKIALSHMPVGQQNNTKMDSWLAESEEAEKATGFQKDWLHLSW